MSRLRRLTLSSLCLFSLLAAAALAGPLRDFRQAPILPPGASVLHDLPYGPDPAQRLDVYRPAGARDAPVIFMVHGGGWRAGDKTSPGVLGHKAARWLPHGFILVSANYRMLPAQDALAQADDIARALAFAQAQAARWGGDPRRFVLMGHSAGAHLVALVNADPVRFARLGAAPVLGAVSLDSGAIDAVAKMQGRHLPLYDPAFGPDPARWRLASPTHALTRQAAPLLAVCSSERRDRPCDEAGHYLARARQLGVRAEILPQARSHAGINRDLGQAGAYTVAVERFLASLDASLRRRLAAPGRR